VEILWGTDSDWTAAALLVPGHKLTHIPYVVMLEDGSVHLANWGGGAFVNNSLPDPDGSAVFNNVKYWSIAPS